MLFKDKNGVLLAVNDVVLINGRDYGWVTEFDPDNPEKPIKVVTTGYADPYSEEQVRLLVRTQGQNMMYLHTQAIKEIEELNEQNKNFRKQLYSLRDRFVAAMQRMASDLNQEVNTL